MNWKHAGFNIDVNGSGQFIANMGNDDGLLYAATLAEAKQKIDAHVKQRGKAMISLPIVAALNGTEMYAGKLVGLNRVDSGWQTDPPFKKRGDDGRLTDLMADTPVNRERIAALLSARKQLRAAEEAVKTRTINARTYGGRIDPADYEALMTRLKTQHDISAKDEA